MDWDEREIHLFVDDQLLNSTPLDSMFNGAGTPPNGLRQPHHLLLNLAIGGMNGGDPSGTTFPAKLDVNYVARLPRRHGTQVRIDTGCGGSASSDSASP